MNKVQKELFDAYLERAKRELLDAYQMTQDLEEYHKGLFVSSILDKLQGLIHVQEISKVDA